MACACCNKCVECAVHNSGWYLHCTGLTKRSSQSLQLAVHGCLAQLRNMLVTTALLVVLQELHQPYIAAPHMSHPSPSSKTQTSSFSSCCCCR
jgi:hypothetical protein